MSLGALSREAHETLAVALNRIGGKSNSGEVRKKCRPLLFPCVSVHACVYFKRNRGIDRAYRWANEMTPPCLYHCFYAYCIHVVLAWSSVCLEIVHTRPVLVTKQDISPPFSTRRFHVSGGAFRLVCSDNSSLPEKALSRNRNGF